jgi:V/A-type H+/Na+-transporting ATPase subunit D
MAKIKLTTQELKRQQGRLRRYQRFLPTLTLKKIQLQIEVIRVRQELDPKRKEETALLQEFYRWIGVLGEGAGITEVVGIEEIVVEESSIAGVEIPVYRGVRFKESAYDLYSTPLWMDSAVEVLRELLALRAEILILRRELDLLETELRTTIQRVNLFEKVVIPQTIENIRRIQIFIADQQTAAVVRGKISKKKLANPSSGVP